MKDLGHFQYQFAYEVSIFYLASHIPTLSGLLEIISVKLYYV